MNANGNNCNGIVHVREQAKEEEEEEDDEEEEEECKSKVS